VIERAVALETTPAVLVERLPDTLQEAPPAGLGTGLGNGFSLDDHLLSIEKGLLEQALAAAGGERTAASRLLGVTPRSLRYLISKHRLGDLE
jgi:two-component system response regulator PilR (NtrC family)